MLLKKLTLDNYKTYYGIQEIDLYIPQAVREEEEKNIILVGGLNGAGKTTILKAILYVLFGKRGMREQEYKQLSANVINNTFFEEGGRQCTVSLIIETDAGEEWNLKVKWSVNNLKSVTHEERDITVRKPGSRINRSARIDNHEAYNRFIDKIIPYHAAPFFIFDGEEIKDIILRQSSDEMKEAIHKISGMDAYKQLIVDLNSLKYNMEKQLANSVSHSKLDNLKSEIEKQNNIIEENQSKKQQITTKIKELEEILSETKKQRNHKIQQNSKSRDTIIKHESRLETELEQAESELKKHFEESVLNIILNTKINNLKKKLRQENEIRNKRILKQSRLVPYQNFMEQLLSHSITPPLTPEQLTQIEEIGQQIWIKDNNIKDNVDSYEELHDISSKEYNTLLNFPIDSKNKVIALTNKIEKIKLELSEIETTIRNAPEAVDIDEENKRIDNLTKNIGECTLKLRTYNQNISSAESLKANSTNKLTRLSDKDVDIQSLQKQYNLLLDTKEIMNQYINDVTLMRAKFIKEEFSSMLQKLFRKQEEFGKIEFDINTYTIRLYNDKMQEISIQDRSAGEMQMISSALIWALTRSSDLSLPIVVDTPLGRLDSYHRNHLINHYYKNLSDQVIILSTDTEVTKEYVDLMKDHSYKQYMLDYNEKKKYTVIKDGYFEFT